MISPQLLQAAIVERLRANAALIALLPGATDPIRAEGIREAEWHGTDFQYPCVRVERPGLVTQPNGGACIDQVADAQIRIGVHSKRDSSITASTIMGAVQDALEGVTFDTAELRTTAMHAFGLNPATPNAEDPNVWTGISQYRTVVTAR